MVMIGLDPEVVDYSKWPGLTREKLEAGSADFRAALDELDYRNVYCLVDGGEGSVDVVVEALQEHRPDLVFVGAGIRIDTDFFLLFEQLINAVHQHAPQARITFNTGISDSADALRRWA